MQHMYNIMNVEPHIQVIKYRDLSWVHGPSLPKSSIFDKLDYETQQQTVVLQQLHSVALSPPCYKNDREDEVMLNHN